MTLTLFSPGVVSPQQKWYWKLDKIEGEIVALVKWCVCVCVCVCLHAQHSHVIYLKTCWFFVVVFFASAPSLPESCLPLGMKASDSKTKVIPVLPSEFHLRVYRRCRGIKGTLVKFSNERLYVAHDNREVEIGNQECRVL